MKSLSKTHMKSLKEKSTPRKKAVAKFKEEVKKGPFYICVVCNISGLFIYLRKISTKLKVAQYLITLFVVLTENSIFA